MNFAKWVFRIAGIYGVLVIAPMYFMESRINTDSPPAITHPEFFYGFIGITLCFQFLFLLISLKPASYRDLFPVCVAEKFTYVIAVACLYSANRVQPTLLPFAGIDFVLGVLFILAYMETAKA